MPGNTKVEPMDPEQENSPLSGPVNEESTVMMNVNDQGCTWNGQSFGEGDFVYDGEAVYECSFGHWVKRD